VIVRTQTPGAAVPAPKLSVEPFPPATEAGLTPAVELEGPPVTERLIVPANAELVVVLIVAVRL